MKTLLIVAVAWAFVTALVLLQLWPHIPQSPKQWIILVVVGPPLYVMAEAAGDWLFSKRHGEAISKDTFSGARILVALLIMLPFMALSWWVSHLMGIQ